MRNPYEIEPYPNEAVDIECCKWGVQPFIYTSTLHTFDLHKHCYVRASALFYSKPLFQNVCSGCTRPLQFRRDERIKADILARRPDDKVLFMERCCWIGMDLRYRLRHLTFCINEFVYVPSKNKLYKRRPPFSPRIFEASHRAQFLFRNHQSQAVSEEKTYPIAGAMATIPHVQDLLSRNSEYQRSHIPTTTFEERFSAGDSPPKVAVVTCADPRCIPEKFLNLSIWEVVVIRTAGSNVKGALTSLIAIDKLAGLEEIMIINHTDCGGQMFRDDTLKSSLHNLAPQLKSEIDAMDFGQIVG